MTPFYLQSDQPILLVTLLNPELVAHLFLITTTNLRISSTSKRKDPPPRMSTLEKDSVI